MAEVQLESEDHQPENGYLSSETTLSKLLTRFDYSVLPFLGGFGKYQKQQLLLTLIPALFIGFSQYSDHFLLAQPNSTCIQPWANLTNFTSNHSSLSLSPNNTSGLPAYVNASGSYSSPNNAQCRCHEWTFELHTGLVQNVVTKWSLVCDSAWKVHIAKFSFLVGSIVGFLVLGTLSDWFGRLPVLIISVLLMLIFGITVAFSINVQMFSTLRFFEGFCLAGIILSLYVLRIELCLPSWRFAVTMVASFVTLCGELLLPGVAYLCQNWQVLQIAIVCPLLLMLSYYWIFPESLRWLLATQQYYRSKCLMEVIAKKNKVNTELDPHNILSELQKGLPNKPQKICILKMLRARNLWKNICVLCLNSLTGNGIHQCFARRMMDPEATGTVMFHNFYVDYYTMGGIAVASYLALCPAVGLLGRRGGLLMFMVMTALASLLQLGLLSLLGKYSDNLNIDKSDVLMKNFYIVFSVIGMFASQAVSNLTILFSAELTPTVMRGGGLGLVLASAGFGMLTAPIMDLHNQKGFFLHHIVFACCTLICFICILLLPETRYQFLPETLDDGKAFTRKPLLSPRRPIEQRLLLAQCESSRDYSRVYDTPLHEAAATAVSTMGSTTASAVDLTAPSVGNTSAAMFVVARAEKSGIKDPNGHSVSSLSIAAQGEDVVINASNEHLLSSTPLHQSHLAKDPLLVDEIPSAVVVACVEPLTEAVINDSSDHVNSNPPFPEAACVPKADSSSLSLHDSLPQLSEPSGGNISPDPPPTTEISSSIPEQLDKVDECTITPPSGDSQPLESTSPSGDSSPSLPGPIRDSPSPTPPPPSGSCHTPPTDSCAPSYPMKEGIISPDPSVSMSKSSSIPGQSQMVDECTVSLPSEDLHIHTDIRDSANTENNTVNGKETS